MLTIDSKGVVANPKIRNAISPMIEHAPMPVVKGIIVHQTGGPTAQSTFNSYARPHADGAHFLIDKDGTIYQTASVFRKTYHVGKLQSRCLAEMTCPPAELKIAQKWDPGGTHKRESTKEVPNRYPSNDDAIGIEIVGMAFPKDRKKVYEPVTPAQNASLKWLVHELSETMKVPMTEIFRHPTVSHKEETEAATASW